MNSILHTGIIKEVTDLKPYIDDMVDKLGAIGRALELTGPASAVMRSNIKDAEKCYEILTMWFDREGKPTWEGFCRLLNTSCDLKTLATQIAEDHAALIAVSLFCGPHQSIRPSGPCGLDSCISALWTSKHMTQWTVRP